MAKLTLSVDDRVVSSAKRYAKQRRLSISEMVESYLAAVTGSAPPVSGDTPILRSLRGALKKADLQEFRTHQTVKYR